MEPIELNEDQMGTLADLIAAKMTATNKVEVETPTPETPTPETPNEHPQGGNKSPTLEEITAAVTASLQANDGAKNQKIFDVMWEDKLKNTTSAVQGLGDFLDGEDDYGSVRGDKLKSIEDFNERVSALDKLTNSFREASAGQVGRKPIVNKVAQKKAEESDAAYKELERKQSAGEFTSVADMANQYMAKISQELGGLI